MTNYISTPDWDISTTPIWTIRNKFISNYISPNSNIVDLGCGNKDLLKYVIPKNYLGVDFENPYADLNLNLNLDFNLSNINFDIDYIVASGLLEYLDDVGSFFKNIKCNSKFYIFTYWKIKNKIYNLKNKNAYSIDHLESLINQNFSIVETDKWKQHNIYICKDITK